MEVCWGSSPLSSKARDTAGLDSVEESAVGLVNVQWLRKFRLDRLSIAGRAGFVASKGMCSVPNHPREPLQPRNHVTRETCAPFIWLSMLIVPRFNKRPSRELLSYLGILL